MRPRILIDVSAHCAASNETPNVIRRTEREIARRLLDDAALHTLPIIFQADSMLAVDPRRVIDLLTCDRWAEALDSASTDQWDEATAQVPAPEQGLPSNDRSGVEQRARRLARRVRSVAGHAAISMVPERARDDVEHSLRRAERAVQAILRPGRPQPQPEPPAPSPSPQRAPFGDPVLVVHPGADDVVWTCGPAHPSVSLRRLGEAKLVAGFCLASVCYDLTTVRRSACRTPQGWADVLVARTVDQLDASDLIFCLSGRVRDDLQWFASETGRATPSTRLLQLGADLPSSGEYGAPPSPRIARLSMRLSTRRFALAVGTVEPCKNYRLLLEVWRHLLLERDFDLDLVLVGREGHAATEIVMMLRQSPVLQERVHWLPQLADSELAALYNGCHIFVCPNLEESAPLPISEALAHRRVVLCSDRVSLPTSIHERLTRLDPLDAQRWRAAIREAATASPAEVYAEKLPTWDSCAAQVRDELLALAEAG